MNHKMFHFSKSPSRLAAIKIGFQEILRTPLISLIIISAIAISLILSSSSYLLWKNSSYLDNKLNSSSEISVYLKKKIAPNKITELVEKLNSNSTIAKVELITPEDGMKTFIENTNLDTLLSSFKDNPLPSVIIIQPEVKTLSKEQAEKLIETLNSYQEVEIVKADTSWIEQTHSWLNLWGKISWFFALALGINALFIVGGISHIGSGFFLLKNRIDKRIIHYQFAWYGLIGSLLALLLLKIIIITLQNYEIISDDFPTHLRIFILSFIPLLGLISAKIGTNSKA